MNNSLDPPTPRGHDTQTVVVRRYQDVAAAQVNLVGAQVLRTTRNLSVSAKLYVLFPVTGDNGKRTFSRGTEGAFAGGKFNRIVYQAGSPKAILHPKRGARGCALVGEIPQTKMLWG